MTWKLAVQIPGLTEESCVGKKHCALPQQQLSKCCCTDSLKSQLFSNNSERLWHYTGKLPGVSV